MKKLIDYDKFILDNGKIRNCQNNINKMTYIEFLIFNLPKINKQWFIDYFYEPAKEAIRYTCLFWSGIILFLLFPISYPTIILIRYLRRKRK